jgi:hypothetical protein
MAGKKYMDFVVNAFVRMITEFTETKISTLFKYGNNGHG